MSKARILVVEDEGMTALAAKTALTRAGYEVPGMASSGEEAVRLSAEVGPDLVIMDIRLEGKVDGVEAARRIRDGLRIPVIYLTAYSDEGTLSRARITEPFGYLLKPFNEESLVAAVEMSLYKGEIEKQLRSTKAKLEAILQCVSDAIIVADMRGIIDYVNPATASLLGIPEEHMAGLSLFKVVSLLDETSGAKVVIPFEQVVLEGETVAMQECTLVTMDDRELTVGIDVAPYWDETGTGRGMVLAIRNVSQRHDLEDLSNDRQNGSR